MRTLFLLRNTRKTELPSAPVTRVFLASLVARTAPFALKKCYASGANHGDSHHCFRYGAGLRRMIPYVTLPDFEIGPVGVGIPSILMLAGVLVAHFLWLRRATRLGLDGRTTADMSLAMVIAGFMGAHLFHSLYYPAALSWIDVWNHPGISSFGGISGGLLAAAWFAWRHKLGWMEGLRYLDALAYVFPRGWILGRLACFLAHDHPGWMSDSWLAVKYPEGPRWDLGLLEVIFCGLVLIPLFAWMGRRPHGEGFWLGTLLMIYSGFRLGLDTLHVDPPRYGALSVDQWAYGTLLGLGLAVFWKRRLRVREHPAQ